MNWRLPLAGTLLVLGPVVAGGLWAEDPPRDRSVFLQAVDWLAAGEQSKAESLVSDGLAIDADNQPRVFLNALLVRSRFDVASALPLLKNAANLNSHSDYGVCAQSLAALDDNVARVEQLDRLKVLSDRNPGDPLLAWAVGIACRTLNANETGCRYYRRVLGLWQPGPVLVHQTYANLLNSSGRFTEALVERRLAVAQEPRGWSFDGLGLDQMGLNHAAEAAVAWRNALEQDPLNSTYRSRLIKALFESQQWTDVCTEAADLIAGDPLSADAWELWGRSLLQLNRVQEAQEKLSHASQLAPSLVEVKVWLAEARARGGAVLTGERQ